MLRQLPDLSPLYSHDQPAARIAAGTDTPFGYQCSMSSYSSESVLLTTAHAWTYIIMCPSAVITHTSPSGLNPWPNKWLALRLNACRHMFRRMRPWVCNWNKTVAEVMALWFWWRVINPTRSKYFLSIHLTILSHDLTVLCEHLLFFYEPRNTLFLTWRICTFHLSAWNHEKVLFLAVEEDAYVFRWCM